MSFLIADNFMSKQSDILDEVISRLGNLKTINQYPINVARIYRSRLTNYELAELPAVNATVSQDLKEKETYGTEKRTCTLIIQYSDSYSSEDKNRIDTSYAVGNALATVVFRSVDSPLPEDDVDLDLSGLVDNLSLTSITPFVGMPQSDWSGVIVSFDVTYACSIGTYL
jgi:hypothetical protein